MSSVPDPVSLVRSFESLETTPSAQRCARYVGRVGALAMALGVDRYPGANRVRTFAAASSPAWMAPS